METIQQAMKRTELAFEAGLPGENKRRKIIVVTIGVLVLCCWALLALYSIVGGKQNDLSFAPEVVYMPQAPAPEAGSGPSFYQSPRRGTLMYKPAASYQRSAVSYTPAPKAQMGSTSYRVHQTSKATVHSYGGGGLSGGGNTGAIIRRSSNSNNNYAYAGGSLGGGVSYATLAYSGAIYVPTKHNAVTEVGSLEASDVTSQKIGVIRRAKMDFPGDENPDPGANPEPPVPVGDMPLAMLALLAAGYALRVALRRKEECTGIAG